MFTKRCSPMHYISICTKQMSLQALYGIVAALTQLFSALNISSCSHPACYVHINKNPLERNQRGGRGGEEIIVVQAWVAGITTMYSQNCVTLWLRQVSNCSGRSRLLLSTACTVVIRAGAAGSCWPVADRFTKICMNRYLETLNGLVPVLLEFWAGLESV